MIVLIVSECSGKSRQRSKRILDGYLPRIGRRTWSGAISADGLERLRKQVKEKASRTTAIACHKVQGGSMRIAWRIGAKHAFDGIGRVPVHVSGRSTSGDIKANVKAACLSHIVRIAALLHDLGKCSPEFQAKLRGGPNDADPYRHELVSLLLLRTSLDPLLATLEASVPDPDQRFLKALASPAFITALEDTLKGFKPSDDGKDPLPRGKGDLYRLVCGLVLSHHKLIASQASFPGLPPGLNASRSIREGKSAPKRISTSLDAFGYPEDVESWKARLRESAEALLTLDEWRHIDLDGRRAFAIHGRLALMLGDRHASVQGWARTDDTDRSTRLFANTRNVEKSPILNQTLAEHLLAVATASGAAASAVLRHTKTFPCLSTDEIPHDLAFPKTSGKFAWQGEAVDLIRRHRETRQGEGFLAYVMAGTGSGKTRAIPSVLAAARGELRYTAGLNMRSLTLQTGKEYRRRLDLPALIVIGSPLTKLLDSLSDPDPEESKEGGDPLKIESPRGTDAQLESPIAATEGDAPVLELPGMMLRFCDRTDKESIRQRELAFMAAPIVCCTLDMTMSPTGYGASYLMPALRLATADLVIDEIDDFSPEDVAAICRAVELSASFGRSVLVSSATIPRGIAIAIRHADASGRRMYANLHGATRDFDVAWLSNLPGTSIIEKHGAGVHDEAKFVEAHAGFTARLAEGLASQHSGRKAETIAREATTSRDSFAACIDGIQEMHVRHHAICPRTGKRVSIGLVRFSNVKSTLAFGRALVQAKLGLDLTICAYNGTLLPIVRHHVEGKINRILDRSGEIDPLFVEDSPFRNEIETSTSPDVCLVVIATSIEDVGRDHDFDWAIAEPASVRSLVQIAGRVRRHRPALPPEATANLFVLEKCIKDLEGVAGSPLSYPGIDTPFRSKSANGTWIARTQLSDHRASSMFQGEGFDRNIDAAGLIGEPRSPLGRHEANRWQEFLLEGANDGLHVSVKENSPDWTFADLLPARRRFRRSGQEVEVFLDDGKFRRVLPRLAPIDIDKHVRRVAAFPDGAKLIHVLPRENVEAAARDLAESLPNVDVEATTRELLTLNLAGVWDRSEVVIDPIAGAYLQRRAIGI